MIAWLWEAKRKWTNRVREFFCKHDVLGEPESSIQQFELGHRCMAWRECKKCGLTIYAAYDWHSSEPFPPINADEMKDTVTLWFTSRRRGWWRFA